MEAKYVYTFFILVFILTQIPVTIQDGFFVHRTNAAVYLAMTLEKVIKSTPDRVNGLTSNDPHGTTDQPTTGIATASVTPLPRITPSPRPTPMKEIDELEYELTVCPRFENCSLPAGDFENERYGSDFVVSSCKVVEGLNDTQLSLVTWIRSYGVGKDFYQRRKSGKCRSAKHEGENQNHLYCEVQFKGDVISEEGVILKKGLQKYVCSIYDKRTGVLLKNTCKPILHWINANPCDSVYIES